MFDKNNVPRDAKPEQKLKKEESVSASGRGRSTFQKDFRQGKREGTNGGSRKRNNDPRKDRGEPPGGPPEGGPDDEGDSSDNDDEDEQSTAY